MNRSGGMARAGLHGLALCALTMFLTIVCSAQTAGSITARITDPDGNVVPKMTFTVKNTGTHAARTAVTNNDDVCDVSAAAQGFKFRQIGAQKRNSGLCVVSLSAQPEEGVQ